MAEEKSFQQAYSELLHSIHTRANSRQSVMDMWNLQAGITENVAGEEVKTVELSAATAEDAVPAAEAATEEPITKAVVSDSSIETGSTECSGCGGQVEKKDVEAFDKGARAMCSSCRNGMSPTGLNMTKALDNGLTKALVDPSAKAPELPIDTLAKAIEYLRRSTQAVPLHLQNLEKSAEYTRPPQTADADGGGRIVDRGAIKCRGCGHPVELEDAMTNECEGCGSLYNGVGQSLRPRHQWEENY